MSGESLQQKQRRRQKAVKEPVAASRVIKNQLYGTGWSGKLSVEEKRMATGLLDDAAAMYELQIACDRELSPPSLYNAILWEYHQLSKPGMVSIPTLSWEQHENFNDQKILTGIIHSVPFFSTDKEAWKDAFNEIVKKDYGSTTLEIHELFSYIRDSEFTIWPVLVDGFWVTIIMRVEPMDTPEFERVGTTGFYYDKNVSTFAIVDPEYEDSESRRDLVFRRLRRLLQHGAIRLPGDSVISTLRCDVVSSNWETGYMSYAISREFIRRLKVLVHRRERGESGEPDSPSERELLWSPFEEAPCIGGYRESLIGACSNYVIEASGYRIRSALEVPSAAAGHEPERLYEEAFSYRPRSTWDQKINIGDQKRRFKLKMNLPEGFNLESSVDSSQISQLDIDGESEPENNDTHNENEDGGASSPSKSDASDDDDDMTAPKPSSVSQSAALDVEGSETEKEEAAISLEPQTGADPIGPSSPRRSPTMPTSDRESPSIESSSSSRDATSSPNDKNPGASNEATEDQNLRSVASAAESLSQEIEASKSSSEDVTMADAQPVSSASVTEPTTAVAWSSGWGSRNTVAEAGEADDNVARPEAEAVAESRGLHGENVSVEEETEPKPNIYEVPKSPDSDRDTARQLGDQGMRDGLEDQSLHKASEGQVIREGQIRASPLPNETGTEHSEKFSGEAGATKSTHDEDPTSDNDSAASESDAFISEDVAEDYVVSKDGNEVVGDAQMPFEEAPTPKPQIDDEPDNEQSTGLNDTSEAIIEEAEDDLDTGMEGVQTVEEEDGEADTPVSQPAAPTGTGSSVIPGLSLSQPTTTEKRDRETEMTELPSPKRPKEETPEPDANA